MTQEQFCYSFDVCRDIKAHQSKLNIAQYERDFDNVFKHFLRLRFLIKVWEKIQLKHNGTN